MPDELNAERDTERAAVRKLVEALPKCQNCDRPAVAEWGVVVLLCDHHEKECGMFDGSIDVELRKPLPHSGPLLDLLKLMEEW